MKLNSIMNAIKSGKFIYATRNRIAKLFATRDRVVTYRMNYLAPNEHFEDYGSNDWVRVMALQLAAKKINTTNIEGNVAELGVYRGDFARFLNCEFPNRKLFLFDTFEGFDDKDIRIDIDRGHSKRTQDFSNTSEKLVLSKMKYKQKCIIRRGYFPGTANGLENERFSFVSIDADLFEPIYQGLRWFYPRLNYGGIIFVHDYNNREYTGSAEAVQKYCSENGIPYFLLPDECGSAVIMK